jgi:hypothetical protein
MNKSELINLYNEAVNYESERGSAQDLPPLLPLLKEYPEYNHIEMFAHENREGIFIYKGDEHNVDGEALIFEWPFDEEPYLALDADMEWEKVDRNLYDEPDGQPDEAQEWHDFDPDC